MSHDLSWNKHYDYLLSKAYRTLGLLRRTFSNTMSIHAKKVLNISLVRSRLSYCSPIWRPRLLKDIKSIENVQRRATKYILQDYKSCYRSRLIKLHMLPLMVQFEITDIMFFVTSTKSPSAHFKMLQHVNFSKVSTRSSSKFKLVHNLSRFNHVKHFYFNRLPRLWNSLRTIDTNQSVRSIKHKLQLFFWRHFVDHFDPFNLCTLHFICPCSKCAVLPISCNFHECECVVLCK